MYGKLSKRRQSRQPTLVIPAPRKLRQEDHEFEPSGLQSETLPHQSKSWEIGVMTQVVEYPPSMAKPWFPLSLHK